MNRKLQPLHWNRMRNRLPHPDKYLETIFHPLELNNIRWVFHQHTNPFRNLRGLERHLYRESLFAEDGISHPTTTHTTQPRTPSDSEGLAT